jgi:hypothetical protein
VPSGHRQRKRRETRQIYGAGERQVARPDGGLHARRKERNSRKREQVDVAQYRRHGGAPAFLFGAGLQQLRGRQGLSVGEVGPHPRGKHVATGRVGQQGPGGHCHFAVDNHIARSSSRAPAGQVHFDHFHAAARERSVHRRVDDRIHVKADRPDPAYPCGRLRID